MTLEQAWKSGLPMKRPSDSKWREPSPKMILSSEDVIAVDWVTQPQDVITDLDGLRKAWQAAHLDAIVPAAVFLKFAEVLGVPGIKKEPEGDVNGKPLGRGLGSLIPGACL